MLQEYFHVHIRFNDLFFKYDKFRLAIVIKYPKKLKFGQID